MNHRNAAVDLSFPVYPLLLGFLKTHRFATSHQLTRFTLHLYGSRRSAIRQTLRHLAALHDQHLVAKLERRVGGWQGGSQSTIWTLTTKGRRQLTGERGRLRPHHHSTTFLEHSLAVTETHLTLYEAAAQLHLHLTTQTEPGCWRRYLTPHGTPVTLKPDAAATVTSSEFIDRYFIEVDRATENPARVIRKCWQYVQYQHSGAEQQKHGVYPAVIWLVPHTSRKAQLERAISVEPGLPVSLFVVRTLDELNRLIRDGPSSNT